MKGVLAVALLLLPLALGLRAQEAAPEVDPLHRQFDTILDIYVRDGLVYYQALKIERPRFDAYVAGFVSCMDGRGYQAEAVPSKVATAQDGSPATEVVYAEGEQLRTSYPADAAACTNEASAAEARARAAAG